jgi:hypothetical protein
MAVSPLGGQIYTSQGSPAATQLQQTVTQRFDMQAYVIAEEEREKEPQIEPVGESDNSQKINADDGSKHNKDEYEQKKREKKEEEEEAEEAPHKSNHLLDLKV